MMMKTVALYQIAVYTVSVYAFSFGSTTYLQGNSSSNLLIRMGLLLFSLCMILMNLSLFFNLKAKTKLKVLIIQKWVNFSQIFQLSILGFSYDFIMGNYLVAYYYYDDRQMLAFGFDLLKFKWVLAYQPGTVIFFGLSIIPIIIFILLNHLIQTSIRKIENQMIDLISRD
jgi:hypothetical protein